VVRILNLQGTEVRVLERFRFGNQGVWKLGLRDSHGHGREEEDDESRGPEEGVRARSLGVLSASTQTVAASEQKEQQTQQQPRRSDGVPGDSCEYHRLARAQKHTQRKPLIQ